MFLSCRREEWTVQECNELIASNSPWVAIDPIAVSPSWLINGFNSETSIVVFQSGVKNSERDKAAQVMYQIDAEDGKLKKLGKRENFVGEFDYSDTNGYLFLSDKGMVWLPNNSDQEVVIPMVEPVTQAIWYGDELILNTNEQSLFFMNQSQISWADIEGNIKQQWSFPFRVFDYLVNNKTLILTSQDTIHAYFFPEMLKIWSFSVNNATDEFASGYKFSDNQLSIASQIGGVNKDFVNKLYFSTPSAIYRLNTQLMNVETVWVRSNCYVLEKSLDISGNGRYLSSAISEVYNIQSKKTGVLILDLQTGEEKILFP